MKVFIIQKFTFSIITKSDSDGYTYSHQNQIFSNTAKRPKSEYYRTYIKYIGLFLDNKSLIKVILLFKSRRTVNNHVFTPL